MRDDTKNGCVAGLLAMEPGSESDQPPTLGLSRLCSATLEQLLAFGATFCGSSNLEQILPFWSWATSIWANVVLEHISSKKKSTISLKTSDEREFLECLPLLFYFLVFFKFYFNFFKIKNSLSFQLFFLTDVSNYCEQRKIKLLINVYIKISRNLGGNFWNLGSNFLAFQWATFQYFTCTIGKGLLLRGTSRVPAPLNGRLDSES